MDKDGMILTNARGIPEMPLTLHWEMEFVTVLRSSSPIPWSHDTPPPNQRRPGAAFEPHTSDII